MRISDWSSDVCSSDLPKEAAAPAASGTQAAAKAGQTIRVDLEKLDRLVNTVGELVIIQAMLAQQLSIQGVAQIPEVADLDHLNRELQDCAMSIRDQPIRSVFSRVPRIVRELEKATGKWELGIAKVHNTLH